MHIPKAWKHCRGGCSPSAFSLVSPSTPQTHTNGLMCYCLTKWLNTLYVKDNLLSGRFWHASPWKHIKSSCHLKRKEMGAQTFGSTPHKMNPTKSAKIWWLWQWVHRNTNFAPNLCQKGMRKQNRKKPRIRCKPGGKCLLNPLCAVSEMSRGNTRRRWGTT